MSPNTLNNLIGCASVIIMLITAITVSAIGISLGFTPDKIEFNSPPMIIGTLVIFGAAFGSKALLKEIFKSKLIESENEK